MYRDYWLLGLSRPASRVCSPSPEQMTLCCRVAKSTIRAGEKMKAGGETRRICLFDFLMRLLVSFRSISRLGAKKGGRKNLSARDRDRLYEQKDVLSLPKRGSRK